MVKDKNTEQRIFEAARAVFVRKGLSGARMQEIANEAGINKALLHYYYRSKEQLFEGIFKSVFEQLAAGFGDILHSSTSVQEKFGKIVDLYFETLLSNRYLPLFVLNEMQQNPEKLESLLNKNLVDYFKPFFNDIENEMKTGKIKRVDPLQLLLSILGMIIFPFAAYPILSQITGKISGRNYDEVLLQRKQHIFEFINSALTPNSK